MPKVALTIGGSDSGGGAGIQADIKTFSALGLHGTSVITAVTAQNTLGVQRVIGLEPDAVSAQLRSVMDDFHIDFAKTGMLYSSEIVKTVAEHLAETKIPFVLDPVIEAEAGGRLLRPEAVEAVKDNLIALAYVVTPNIFEAQALTGVPVRDAASAAAAARKILDLGANAVMIKGGHLDCIDFLLDDSGLTQIPGKRSKGGNHGVGCTYSAAMASFLANGYSLKDAARLAKKFASQAISNSMDVGRGVGPVSQIGTLLKEAYRYEALSDVQIAVKRLEEGKAGNIIPKAGSSIAMAISDAAMAEDIAEARIIREGEAGVHQLGCIKFGTDSLLTRIILGALMIDRMARAAMILELDADSLHALGIESASVKGHLIEGIIDASGISLRAFHAGEADGCFAVMIAAPDIKVEERLSVLIGTSASNVAETAVSIAALHTKPVDHSDGKL